jgi:hypothetical protein
MADEKEEKKGLGRPTTYKQEYNEQAEKLCKLGATDTELAEFFNCAESTLNLWKIEHQDFSESLKKGKILADANVAERLYQRAMGFEHESEEIKVIPRGNGEGSDIERVPITKIYPPDTAAAIFWLKNRQKKKWRDKVENVYVDDDGNPLPVQIIRLPDNGRPRIETKGEGG